MRESSNDGKDLEELVKIIEGMRLPPGFSVTTNKRIFNDSGKQIAELDVLITGTVGSVTYKTLFECRDRPSEGAADGKWINELIGKRQVLGLTTVVAVSTTGFSPGAIEFAKQGNIPLRTVASLTEAEIRGFLPQTAPFIHQRATPKRIQIYLIPEGVILGEKARMGDVISQTTTLAGDSRILHVPTNEMKTIIEIWDTLQQAEFTEVVYGGVSIDGVGVERTIEFGQAPFKDYVIVQDQSRLQIGKMVVSAIVTRTPSSMKLQSAVNYSGGADDPTVVATWTGDGAEGINKMVLLLSVRKAEAE